MFLCISGGSLSARTIQTQFLNISDHIKTSILTNKQKDILNLSVELKNKTLPSWMLENIRSELKDFECFSPEQLEKYYMETSEICIHFRIRNGCLFGRINNADFDSSVKEFGCCLYKILSYPGFKIESGDYLLNFSDGVEDTRSKYPIFCFSKNAKSNFVNIPDWFSISPDYIQTMNEVEWANREFPWKNKIKKAFWIGNANGGFSIDDWKTRPRSMLVFFALDHPDLIWARISLEKQDSAPNKEVESLRNIICHPRISIAESCKYKYLVDVDGNSSSFYRPHWILRSNSVLIKQNSRNFQWFYSGMQPYVHYIPYETDCSDLLEIINWLKNNDAKAYKIALNGRFFAKNWLNLNMSYLYIYHLLIEQNKLNKICK